MSDRFDCMGRTVPASSPRQAGLFADAPSSADHAEADPVTRRWEI